MIYKPADHTPTEAGKYDPTMTDWLALPVGHGKYESECPSCGSTYFGTLNPTGYFLVRICHDQNGQDCRQQFRVSVSPELISDVIAALLGRPRRF